MDNQGNIHLSDRKVTTVAPKDTTEIQLRLLDWHRIYRNVRSISSDVSGRELTAGVFWGIAGSGFLSLIPLYQSAQSSEPWVKPTFWSVSIGSMLIGFIIWKALKDKSQDVLRGDETMLNFPEDYVSDFYSNYGVK